MVPDVPFAGHQEGNDTPQEMPAMSDEIDRLLRFYI
jgi:hypothetical protein